MTVDQLQSQWDAAQQGTAAWIILAIAAVLGLRLLEWAFKEPPKRDGPWKWK